MRSLNLSERFEELTQEVEGCRWDATFISETWRASNAEIWETQQGRRFMGAGKYEKVEIRPAWESAKYLGQKIIFRQQETAEIKNRISAAWASIDSTENASPHHPDEEEKRTENADQ